MSLVLELPPELETELSAEAARLQLPLAEYALRVLAGGGDDQSRQEFRKLYDVAVQIITLPEFIQSELSRNSVIPKRSLGKLKCVKPLKKPEKRLGTDFETDHKMDLAAILPMASAFRELLVLKGDRYAWKVDPYDAFRRCIEPLYQVLVARSGKLRTTSQLGADMEYWGACVPIVMRTKDQMIESKLANVL